MATTNIGTGIGNSLSLVSPGTISASGTIQSAATLLANQINVSTIINATGNINGGNIFTTGNISSTGNITGNNLNLRGTFSPTTINATGNVAGGNILTAGKISSTGTIQSASTVIANQVNVSTTINATGNITGGNILTNGVVSTSGNIVGGNLSLSGTFLSSAISSPGNITGSNVNANTMVANVAVANVFNGLTVQGTNITATNLTVNNINGSPVTVINGPAFIATQTVPQTVIPYGPTIALLPLIYNTVTQNIGGGYNSTTGVFTAPIAGFYQVSASAVAGPTGSVRADFYGAAALILYVGSTAVDSGPYVESRTLTYKSSPIYTIIDSSNLSKLVYLYAGQTMNCKLAYITNGTNIIAYGNLIPAYFSACWLRP